VGGFETSVSARDDGTLEAMYIRFRQGKVAKTREIIEDVLLADYNARGELMGMEVLDAVRLSDLARLVEQPRRKVFREVIKRTAPQEFIHA
jgi:uncharacterized protein YuzE